MSDHGGALLVRADRVRVSRKIRVRVSGATRRTV
jgi:hypothetical protein